MIEDRIRAFAGELAALRHDLHMHPELFYEESRTAAVVAKELTRLGFAVATGIAGTGVVGTLRNGTGRRSIGLRADMDALPIHEETNLPWASRTPGRMHACGHDGHTAMLLGAARYLAETRNFDGTVHLIFQPAEENGGGAKRMIDDGLLRRFPCDAVFAAHNLPGEAVGQVVVRPGPITAAVDIATVTIRGIGGHGAFPHKTVDPIVAAASTVMALQTIVSRNIDAHDPAVITVGAFNAGGIATIIPGTARLEIGIRTTTATVRELVLGRLRDLLSQQAKSFGCTAKIDLGNDADWYPPGFNTPAETALVRDVALSIGQKGGAIDLRGPFMFSEDFAFIQQAVPSCYFGIGNGDSRNLHDAGYDFNDDLLVKGPAFWARLVEKVLPRPA